MNNKTKKRALMESWKKKWDNPTLKRRVGDIVGSRNKKEQIMYLSDEYDNLSKRQALKKMKEVGFNQKERKKFIESNEEMKRVFGVEDEGNKEPSKWEKRRMKKKAEIHKKFMVRRSKQATLEQKKQERKNRVARAYESKSGSAKEYGYKTVEDEGHHEATALGGNSGGGAASVTKQGSGGGVVGSSSAQSLTGGNNRSSAKGGRPIGL